MAHEGLVKLIGSSTGLGAYLAHAQAWINGRGIYRVQEEVQAWGKVRRRQL